MSKKMRYTGHVARMQEIRTEHNILVGNPEGTTCSEDAAVDGRIVLKWISKGQSGKVWPLRIGTGGELLWTR
jgi:hypothetical protein